MFMCENVPQLRTKLCIKEYIHQDMVKWEGEKLMCYHVNNQSLDSSGSEADRVIQPHWKLLKLTATQQTL